MEQSAGDGAATFSLRVEKRTTLERYREKKKEKKGKNANFCFVWVVLIEVWKIVRRFNENQRWMVGRNLDFHSPTIFRYQNLSIA